MYRDNTEEIINDFDDAKFLYLMRDPRENFLSQNQYFYNKFYTMTPFRNNQIIYTSYKNFLSKIMIC